MCVLFIHTVTVHTTRRNEEHEDEDILQITVFNSNKAGQDKTRQGKAGQDKTRQGKADTDRNTVSNE